MCQAFTLVALKWCVEETFASLQANMFQPVHRRVEMVSEQQRDMEQAFESLLVKQHGK